jgi:hypothetical protein
MTYQKQKNKILAAILAFLVLVPSIGIFPQPTFAGYGTCKANPGTPKFAPAKTTATKGESIDFTITVEVVCPDRPGQVDPPAAGYRAILFLVETSGNSSYIGDLPFPADYEKREGGKFTYKITGSFIPFNDNAGSAKSRVFKPTAYRPSNNTGIPGNPVTITLGTAPPGNNPSGNNCTGNACGKTIGGDDFDKEVGKLVNPINVDSFPELVLFVMKGFILLIGILAVLVIIIGGVRMVLSQGNQESITKGKQTVVWAVAGLIVALLSFSIVSIVQNLLSKPGQ